MNTLYISDLDGTLLNDNAEISENDIRELNRLISNGLNFTAASARTHVTIIKILEKANIKLPVITMNGAAIYDLRKKKYTYAAILTDDAKKTLIDIIHSCIRAGFLYTIEDGILHTYYETAKTPAAKAFIEERERKYNKKFTQISSFEECIDKDIIYYSVADKPENLQKPYDILKEHTDLHVDFYHDIYTEGCMYLEISSAKASKKNALLKLKKDFGFHRVVSFGDNLNDLPMFEVSDECYATANAKQIVKEKATGIIGSNTDGGVIDFLKSNTEFTVPH
ncbi:MAG: HAD family hydrolase [Clostridiales bacterium]|nr:HAD family hydrolase [Clostridiales bacterium]